MFPLFLTLSEPGDKVQSPTYSSELIFETRKVSCEALTVEIQPLFSEEMSSFMEKKQQEIAFLPKSAKWE